MKSKTIKIVLALVGAVLIVGAIIVGPRLMNRLNLQYGTPPVCAVQPEEVAVRDRTWSEGATGPSVRSASAFTILDDRIYQAGGFVIDWQPTADFDVYDPGTDSWQSLAPLPTVRHRPGLTSVDGKIYLTGGFDGPIFWEPTLNDTWVYDPTADEWTEIAPMPSARAAHTMVNLDGQLYVVGGQGPDAREIWVYDAERDRWDTSRAQLPVPERDNATGVVMDGKLYLVGGRWIERDNFGFVDVYDPVTDTWERRQDMLNPRSTIAGVVIGDQIHFLGGQDIDRACTFNIHEIYDPAMDSWTRLANLPTPRHSAGVAFVGDRLYLVGGATGAGPYMQYRLSGLVEMLDF